VRLDCANARHPFAHRVVHDSSLLLYSRRFHVSFVVWPRRAVFYWAANASLGTASFTSLAPWTIQAGTNTLPGGGTLIVDPKAGTAIATVTAANGTVIKVFGQLNSDGSVSIVATGSNGWQWSQVLPAASTSPTSQALTLRPDINGCAIAGKAAAAASGVAGIAGGVAWAAAQTGAAGVPEFHLESLQYPARFLA